jgi:hypothetical protein
VKGREGNVVQNYEAIRKLAPGEALPFVAQADGEPFPVLVGIADAAPEGEQVGFKLFASYAQSTANPEFGASVRVAVQLRQTEKWRPVFGEGIEPEPAECRSCQVLAWLDPADEYHSYWVSQAERLGAFGVEIVAPESVDAWLADPWHGCRRLEFPAKFQGRLGEDMLRGMRHDCEQPWEALRFPEACVEHEARHPIAAAFAG